MDWASVPIGRTTRYPVVMRIACVRIGLSEAVIGYSVVACVASPAMTPPELVGMTGPTIVDVPMIEVTIVPVGKEVMELVVRSRVNTPLASCCWNVAEGEEEAGRMEE